MKTFVNEQTVMQFYINQLEADAISFLKGKDAKKAKIRDLVEKLMAAETMNGKITIACDLWKALFDASLSYINPNKHGYDRIFNYFDSYVEFEELIFASDSFYLTIPSIASGYISWVSTSRRTKASAVCSLI